MLNRNWNRKPLHIAFPSLVKQSFNSQSYGNRCRNSQNFWTDDESRALNFTSPLWRLQWHAWTLCTVFRLLILFFIFQSPTKSMNIDAKKSVGRRMSKLSCLNSHEDIRQSTQRSTICGKLFPIYKNFRQTL